MRMDLWKNPDDNEPVMEDIYGNEIYKGDIYYSVGGTILSEEGLEDCKYFFTEEDESFTCPVCEDTFTENDADYFYLIDGIKYCEDCIVGMEMEA